MVVPLGRLVSWRSRLLGGLAVLFLFLAVTVVTCAGLGSSGRVGPGTVLTLLSGGSFPGDDFARVVVFEIRLPRLFLAFFVGASLSVVGAALQGLLRNPLADPYTLGVASGAAVGAAAVVLLGKHVPLPLTVALPLAAFGGALLTGLAVYRLGEIGGYLAVETLVLAGVIMSSFMSAVLSFLLTLAGESLHQIVYWLMGSLSLRGKEFFPFTFPCLALGILGICLFARELNALAFGEETAGQLGIAVEKTKRLLLFLATLLTGVAVALAGTIGFVGLVVPHLVRLALGPDHRVLLPLAAVGGGIFLIWADAAGRTLLAPVELPVGVVTAFLGAPFFVYLLRKRKAQGPF